MAEAATVLTENSVILISASSEPEGTEQNFMTGFSFDKSRKEIQTTKINSANHTYEAGLKDAKGSFDADLVVDSPTYKIIEDALEANTVVYMTVRLNGTGASKPQEVWPVKITSFNIKGAADDKVSVSVGFVATGNVDATPQAGMA